MASGEFEPEGEGVFRSRKTKPLTYESFPARGNRKHKEIRLMAKPRLSLTGGPWPKSTDGRPTDPKSLPGAVVVKDFDIAPGDEAAFDHLFDLGDKGVEVFALVDDLDDDGKVFGEAEDF